MTAGIWIYEPDGVTVRVGPGTSNVTILGVVSTGTSSGSITNAMLSKGRPVVVSAVPINTTAFRYPKIRFSGNTMTWTFDTAGSSNAPMRIIYGIRA